MKKFFVAIFLLVSLIFTGCIGSSEKIIIGVDDEIPPICFHNDEGDLIGFDVDLIKEAAKRMGVDVEFKPIIWNNKREEITSGKIDMIWNGLDVTEERKEYMIFSEPYMDDRQILLVRSGNDKEIYSEGDLENKRVGVQAGSTSSDYLNRDKNLKKSLGMFKTYPTFVELVSALEYDEIDALICDELIARYEMNTKPDKFQLIDISIGSITKVAIGFRKDNAQLRDRVQQIFNSMVADGTAQQISEKWFQADLIKHKR